MINEEALRIMAGIMLVAWALKTGIKVYGGQEVLWAAFEALSELVLSFIIVFGIVFAGAFVFGYWSVL